MERYYVNNTAQANGDHEVHIEDCYWMQYITDKTDLGNHPNCDSAVKEAKKTHPNANGCATCSPDCHTQ